MRCRQWRRYLPYLACLLLFLALSSSLMMMGYNQGSSSAKNESFPISLDKKTREDEPIPLILESDFKDLGNRKKRVLLLVTVGSAPKRSDRRQGIRSTWWRHCNHSQVKCIFLTDGIIADPAQRALVIQERQRYHDLEFLPVAGGLVFGQRFLNQIKWAKAKFDFQYLLKIDDDYFLCLKRLLSELPLRPKNDLVWGHFHCQAGITWADEAFVIFSKDIIHKFLAQDMNKTLCHPFGDQTFHLWLNNMNKVYFHDARLHHHPPASFSPKFENLTNVCDSYIGIHGTYEKKMREFGLNSNDGEKVLDEPTIPSFSSFCRTTRFDHHMFAAPYKYEPKPCIDNPIWINSTGMYMFGREKQGGWQRAGTRE
ncbi:uncharacterized protein LOC144638940 [Oculina patagonica]